MSLLQIDPLAFPLEAEIVLPASKSIAHRAMICACLREGTTTILKDLTPSEDILIMAQCLQKMGYRVTWQGALRHTLRIVGGMPKKPKRGVVTIDCGESGATLRFLMALSAVTRGRWILTGRGTLRTRPIIDICSSLRALSVPINVSSHVPISITGGDLAGGTVTIDASVSSQYVSALLLIGSVCEQGLTIVAKGKIASESYADLTRIVLRDFGINVRKKSNIFFVQNAKKSLKASRKVVHYSIEADWSAAGSWMTLATLTGSSFRYLNLPIESEQPDSALLSVLDRLQRTGPQSIDCSHIPDQVPNLVVLAAFRSSKTELKGLSTLRHKESDRIVSITRELTKAGVRIVQRNDHLIIHPSMASYRTCSFDPHSDHRIAIACSIFALRAAGCRLKDSSYITKSDPTFVDQLFAAQASSMPIVLIGMRGAGKSTLGAGISQKLGLRFIDTDSVFTKRYGSIALYVTKHGWPAFRAKEEAILRESLSPRTVIALGGGGVESLQSRNLLRQRALVCWIQASEQTLLSRLRRKKRPPITSLSLSKEVRVLLRKRNPLYRDIASIIVPEERTPRRHILALKNALFNHVHRLLSS